MYGPNGGRGGILLGAWTPSGGAHREVGTSAARAGSLVLLVRGKTPYLEVCFFAYVETLPPLSIFTR